MKIQELKESIKLSETLSLKPYVCPAGKLTIGYGRNLQDSGITKFESELLLENDLFDIKLKLEDTFDWYKNLDDVRQNVIIEMVYNMGLRNFTKFKKTIEYLKQKQYLNASVEMLDSKWHEDFKKYDMQDGKKFDGLLRSEYLAKIMKEGKY